MTLLSEIFQKEVEVKLKSSKPKSAHKSRAEKKTEKSEKAGASRRGRRSPSAAGDGGGDAGDAGDDGGGDAGDARCDDSNKSESSDEGEYCHDMLDAFGEDDHDSDADSWANAIAEALGPGVDGVGVDDPGDVPEPGDLFIASDDEHPGVCGDDPLDPLAGALSFDLPPETRLARYTEWQDAFGLSVTALKSRSKGFATAKCRAAVMPATLKAKHGCHNVLWSDAFAGDMPVAVIKTADGQCKAHRFVLKSDKLLPVEVVFCIASGLLASGWGQPLHTDPVGRWAWPTETFNKRQDLKGATVIHPNALVDTDSTLFKTGKKSDRPFMPDTTRQLCHMWESLGVHPVPLLDSTCFICTRRAHHDDLETCACCQTTAHAFCMDHMARSFTPSADPNLLPSCFAEPYLCKLCSSAFKLGDG